MSSGRGSCNGCQTIMGMHNIKTAVKDLLSSNWYILQVTPKPLAGDAKVFNVQTLIP